MANAERENIGYIEARKIIVHIASARSFVLL